MDTERRRVDWVGLVQAAVLLGWTVALWRLGRGPAEDALLGRFLRSEYWWIVDLAAGVFALLFASLVLGRPRQAGLDRRRSVIQAVILALPLLYLPLAVGSDLSLEAAEKRSIFAPRVGFAQPAALRPELVKPARSVAAEPGTLDEPLARTAETPAEPAGPARTERKESRERSKPKPKPATAHAKTHEANLWNLVATPEAFEGAKASVSGIAYKGERLSKDSFFCYRLLMVCCAADASPEGVIVKWPDTPKIKKGSWVKVHGKVGFAMFEGEKRPAILATSVETISPPKNKFLIPR